MEDKRILPLDSSAFGQKPTYRRSASPVQRPKSSGSARIDSGYASQEGSPDGKLEIIEFPKLFAKKRVMRLYEDVTISEAVYHRFEDLQKQSGKPLYCFLRKYFDSLGLISTKLVAMGECQDSAKPCILVQCDARIAAKVRQFFKQNEVKPHYRPLDQELGLPDLEVFVHPHAPQLRGLVADNEAWIDTDVFPWCSKSPILCGYPITALRESGCPRIATLGGFIRVKHIAKDAIYGLTVAHIFRETSDKSKKAQSDLAVSSRADRDLLIDKSSSSENCRSSTDEMSGSCGDNDIDDMDGDSEERGSQACVETEECDNDSVILDLRPSCHTLLEQDDKPTLHSEGSECQISRITEQRPQKAGTSSISDLRSLPSSWSRLGKVFRVSDAQGSGKSSGDKDWALIKIQSRWPFPWDKMTLYEASRADTSKPRPRYTPQPFEAALGRRVFIRSPFTDQVSEHQQSRREMSSSRTVSNFERDGFLGTSYSYIMLGTACDFTQTYALKFTDGHGLQVGECGAWVIDAKTFAVYGHVVASDDLGEAYVIPMRFVFDEIQQLLCGTLFDTPEVEIATIFDLCNCCKCAFCGNRFENHDSLRQHLKDGCHKRFETGMRETLATVVSFPWSYPPPAATSPFSRRFGRDHEYLLNRLSYLTTASGVILPSDEAIEDEAFEFEAGSDCRGAQAPASSGLPEGCHDPFFFPNPTLEHPFEATYAESATSINPISTAGNTLSSRVLSLQHTPTLIPPGAFPIRISPTGSSCPNSTYGSNPDSTYSSAPSSVLSSAPSSARSSDSYPARSTHRATSRRCFE